MTIGVPSGIARDSSGPAQDRPGDAGGRGQGTVAGEVITRPGLLRHSPPRELWMLAAELGGPLAASAVLLPFPASWSNTNAALLLVVVVVAVAAAGNRLAGALAAVAAAVWTGEAGDLATMHGTAALAQVSWSPEAVAVYVGGRLADLLDLPANWNCGCSAVASINDG